MEPLKSDRLDTEVELTVASHLPYRPAKMQYHGFQYKTVPHITLRSIAQNSNLDPIFAKHEPMLKAKLAAGNTALKNVSDKLRNDLRSKLALKQKQEGKKAITDADRRRWDLPPKDKGWQHWEAPSPPMSITPPI